MISEIGIAVLIKPNVPLNAQTESENNQPNPIIREMMAQIVKHENPMKPNTYNMKFLSDFFSGLSIFLNT